MSELLYSINDLFSDTGYLSFESKSHYHIPLYQRGYKWKPKHVTKLLDDIRHFNHGDDKFYCLQNITIVPRGTVYNVVDGQQRLTTLSLILQYMGETELVKDKVKFPDNSIRKYSNEFLNDFVNQNGEDIINQSWYDFIDDSPNYDHQDISHMFTVYQTIQSWFSKQPTTFSIDNYKDKLLLHVKVIINKISGDSNEEKIFGNLNSKRIPLDGADLIRAMLVTRVVHEEAKKEESVKNIVRINEKRVKIGWVIDQVNNWWSQDKIKSFYMGLVSKQDQASLKTMQFNIDFHPINLLYYLYAKSKEEELSLELYEELNNSPIEQYKSIIKLHETLKDWFADREIYHYLGFLIFQQNTEFFTVWDFWIGSDNRDGFKANLKQEIKNSISIENELIDFRNEDVNWYQKNKKSLLKGLILMDVIHSLKNNQAFIPASGFSKDANDIEHIFPQTPETPNGKQKELEYFKSYITFLNQHVVPSNNKKFSLEDYDQLYDDPDYNKKLDKFIAKHTKSYSVHSIGNLVMLNSSLNRSIGNSSYSYKRARLIDHFNKGNYVQPHTFHVFVRYFNDIKSENHDYEHWSQKDIVDNCEKIASTIENFFYE